MKRLENQAPEGMVVFNYAKSKATLPAAADIPTLVPNADKNPIFENDAEPFFKVEAIDFPANGSGGVYDGSFFKSFINVTKDRPIPGSKRGHEWASRGKSDFYTVGGRIDSQDNGKTGTAYLKIYMPPEGDETSNVGLIRDAKAGMVHFSLVSRPDFNVKSEKDEMGNPIQVRHFTASVGAERNDAMEYGAGAMTQIVNSGSIPIDVDAVKALIDAGEIDTTTNIAGDNPIKNGRVYRSVLRRLASRASADDRSVLGEMLSAIDKSKNGRKTVETKEEALEILTNAISNSQVKKEDLAKALGIEMRNESDVSNAETMKALNAKLGDKPLERLDAILAENKKTADDRVKNAVAEVCGPEKIKNAGGVDVDNPSYAYALKACNGLEGDALKNALEGLKKDPVMVALNGQRADGNSQLNRIVTGGSSESGNDSVDGIPTHKIGGK